MSKRSDEVDTLWTPANKVTLLRILLIPVFVVAIVSPWPDWLDAWPDAATWKPWVAAGVFALISVTDSIDGYAVATRLRRSVNLWIRSQIRYLSLQPCLL